MRSLNNFRAEQPHQHAMYYLRLLMTEVAWTKDELKEALDGNVLPLYWFFFLMLLNYWGYLFWTLLSVQVNPLQCQTWADAGLAALAPQFQGSRAGHGKGLKWQNLQVKVEAKLVWTWIWWIQYLTLVKAFGSSWHLAGTLECICIVLPNVQTVLFLLLLGNPSLCFCR